MRRSLMILCLMFAPMQHQDQARAHSRTVELPSSLLQNVYKNLPVNTKPITKTSWEKWRGCESWGSAMIAGDGWEEKYFTQLVGFNIRYHHPTQLSYWALNICFSYFCYIASTSKWSKASRNAIHFLFTPSLIGFIVINFTCKIW